MGSADDSASSSLNRERISADVVKKNRLARTGFGCIRHRNDQTRSRCINVHDLRNDIGTRSSLKRPVQNLINGQRYIAVRDITWIKVRSAKRINVSCGHFLCLPAIRRPVNDLLEIFAIERSQRPVVVGLPQLNPLVVLHKRSCLHQ